MRLHLPNRRSKQSGTQRAVAFARSAATEVLKVAAGATVAWLSPMAPAGSSCVMIAGFTALRGCDLMTRLLPCQGISELAKGKGKGGASAKGAQLQGGHHRRGTATHYSAAA